MIRKDDRTAEQQTTHTRLVIGTDRFMSGWGHARDGASYAAWACTGEDWANCLEWVDNRSDMSRVRTAVDSISNRYRPGPGCAHLHIYVYDGQRHRCN